MTRPLRPWALVCIALTSLLVHATVYAQQQSAGANAGSADQQARGAYLARAGNCMGCHTAQGGKPYAGGRELPTPFGTFVTPNITPDAETGIGRWTQADLWRAMHEGKGRDGTPLYPAFPYTEYTRMSRADSDAIFAYLHALPAVSQENAASQLKFPYSIRPLLYVWRALYFKPGEYQPEPKQSAQWNRGAYLVQGLGHCNACHATRNALGATRGGPLGGGEIAGLNWYAPSLTSSREAGVRDWPVEDIVRLLGTGISPRAVTSGPMAEVVRQSLQHLNKDDLAAMAVYLKSLPETRRAVSTPAPALTEQGRKRLERGAAIYEKHCVDCHGAKGQGAALAYPALAGNRDVTLASPLNTLRSVLNGGYPPSTRGNPRPYGMPPFAQTLSDDEVALVVSYIRNAWGNSADPVTAVQVDRSRSGY
jgi:mono/diheme cytochrome c family protein